MKGLIWVLVAVIAVEFSAIAWMVWDGRQTKAALQKIEAEANKRVTIESVVSASERKLMIQLDSLKRNIEAFKEEQHRENSNLRNINQRLEKRFRDLDVSDRPEL